MMADRVLARRSTALMLFKACLAASLSAVTFGSATSAETETKWPIETKAAQAIVVDGDTGVVLFEKDADAPFPPASLAKLMTMEVVFEALEKGKVALSDAFEVSEHAWRTGGAPSGTSTMFAKLKSKVPLDALIKGTIVQAANDAAIVIAEGMAGSEEAFAIVMNETAASLGLARSEFVNPTGLPADGQTVTARELVLLARHIRDAHPDLYRTYSLPEFEWNKILQRNRNPLFSMGIGATGMGTGFTEAAGYSLVGVTERDGRRTFIALGGLSSIKERAEEARTLLGWSAAAFRREELFAASRPIAAAKVYGGVAEAVALETREPVIAFVPSDRRHAVTAHIVYDGPVRAPVPNGAKIGRIEVRIDGMLSVTHDLFAAEAVDQGTFASRAFDAAQELAFGWIKSL